MVIFFIYAVSHKVSSIILVHTQCLDGVACVAPHALHLNGNLSMHMGHLQEAQADLTGLLVNMHVYGMLA